MLLVCFPFPVIAERHILSGYLTMPSQQRHILSGYLAMPSQQRHILSGIPHNALTTTLKQLGFCIELH